MLAEYRYAMLIHNDDCTDVETTDIVSTLEREIFLYGYHKAFGMGAGPCQLCDKCGKMCKHPGEARPSMEGCGIDVFTTARNNGYPIEVLTSEDCDGNYYGLILIE
jgi:predicted metal-binding protein